MLVISHDLTIPTCVQWRVRVKTIPNFVRQLLVIHLGGFVN